MTRLTHCVLAMLLVSEATVATAGAQGRGRGSSGGPSRMGQSLVQRPRRRVRDFKHAWRRHLLIDRSPCLLRAL